MHPLYIRGDNVNVGVPAAGISPDGMAAGKAITLDDSKAGPGGKMPPATADARTAWPVQKSRRMPVEALGLAGAAGVGDHHRVAGAGDVVGHDDPHMESGDCRSV